MDHKSAVLLCHLVKGLPKNMAEQADAQIGEQQLGNNGFTVYTLQLPRTLDAG
jgi:hypothetical protein